jgi:MOSC domain-containing protein YiiM
MDGRVRALFIKNNKGERAVARDSVEVIPGGFAGDRHLSPGKSRQILLMSGAVMDELALTPGAVYENVVVDGIDVMTLQEGQQLRLGQAVVAVTIPCEPCIQMERVRRGLRDALQNRRGMFVKVVCPGLVRISDPVQVL